MFALTYIETIGGTSFSKISVYDSNKFEDGKIYNLLNYQIIIGCFANWKFDCPEIKVLKFSPSGDYIIAGTERNRILLIDSFEGLLVKY